METKNSNDLFREIFEIAIKARSDLWIFGFISDVENESINKKICAYQQKQIDDAKMNDFYTEKK